SSVFGSGNVTITKGAGSVLANVIVGDFGSGDYGQGSYSLYFQDNSPSILAIQNTYSYSNEGAYVGFSYEASNLLGTTPKRYVHVKMKIQDITKLSGISFNTSISQWDQQDFYFTTPGTNNQTLYTPVIETSILDTPLPVELSAFSAKFKDNNNVELNWVTKTEVNNYGFNVERKVNDGQWNSLTFIEGHGNSNSPKEYSYSDKDLFAGGSKFQYRLKQVDTDGKFEYSDIVEVEILPTKFELSQNYPNPFNPSTTIQFSLPKATQLKINIYNMLGELVETLAEGTYEAGYHKVTFTASNFPSGIYIYRIESNAFTQVRKMVLIK
ncbi:MAG: T9SS type A sorting domain-containing protein, partial [Ignavibacteriaceae bacterium]